MSRLRTLLFVAKDTFRYDKYLHFIRFCCRIISTLTAPKSAERDRCIADVGLWEREVSYCEGAIAKTKWRAKREVGALHH